MLSVSTVSGRLKRAGEAAVLALDASELLLRLFLFDLSLAAQGEDVLFDVDFDVFRREAWDLRVYVKASVLFADVDRDLKRLLGTAPGH